MDRDDAGDTQALPRETHGGADSNAIWALAAGELPPDQREAVRQAIAITPFATEELGLASFVMNDDAHVSAAPVDVEQVMERIRKLHRSDSSP